MIIDNRINRQILGYNRELKKYNRLTIRPEFFSTHMLAVEKNRTELITPEDLRKIRASLAINLAGNLRNLLRSNAN
jgi:hypothetical protein